MTQARRVKCPSFRTPFLDYNNSKLHFYKSCTLMHSKYLVQKYAVWNTLHILLPFLFYCVFTSFSLPLFWSGITHQAWMLLFIFCIFFPLPYFLNFCLSSLANFIGWHDADICHRWEMATPQLPTPRGIMRFDTLIWRLLCSSDVIYLVLWWHPVMMTCHSYLLCALYLYTIRLLFSLYYFGFITHSFVPYLQLMKK